MTINFWYVIYEIRLQKIILSKCRNTIIIKTFFKLQVRNTQISSINIHFSPLNTKSQKRHARLDAVCVCVRLPFAKLTNASCFQFNYTVCGSLVNYTTSERVCCIKMKLFDWKWNGEIFHIKIEKWNIK